MSPDEEIIVYAVRYALGRMTYAVQDVCRYVKSKKNSLSDICKRAIIRDITEEVKRYHISGQTCGMACDEREWLKLVESLKEGLPWLDI